MPRAEDPGLGEALYLGLMSGTSVDGVDAALVRFSQDDTPALAAARTFAWEPGLREEILALSQAAVTVEPDRLARRDHRIGAAFARAAGRLTHARTDTGRIPAGAPRRLPPSARTARPCAMRLRAMRLSPGSWAIPASSSSAPVSPRSPISGAATWLPAARARR